MINKNISKVLTGLSVAVAVGASGAVSAFAQTTNTTTMPALYNQSGIEVNNGNTTALAAGYYFLAPGASSNTEVYYYGNGTYFDSITGMYGGSVSDPNGTAGVAIAGTGAPGVPDTGLGGEAASVWLSLIASGLVVAAGVTYLVRTRVPFLR